MRFLLLLALMPALFANPSDLIATTDGRTVYFHVKSGVVKESWYKLSRLPSGFIDIQQAPDHLTDISSDGAMSATSFFFPVRYCGTAGSSCFVQPSCRGGFEIGPSGASGGSGRETFIRLDSAGKTAWVEQQARCSPFPFTPVPAAVPSGVYDTTQLSPLMAPGIQVATGSRLANRNLGRRLITDSRGALLLNNGRLQWWDATKGNQTVAHAAAAVEAVTDASGCQIVYTTAESTRWLDCANPAKDEDLGFRGRLHALTSDGRMLTYVNTAGDLAVYDRWTRASVTDLIPPGPIESLAIGGTQSLFITSQGNGLLHMDLYSGEVTTLLPPLPELSAVRANSPLYLSCPLYCYGPIEPAYLISPGSRILASVRDAAGWSWSIDDQPVSPDALQAPYESEGRHTVTLTNPAVPFLKPSMTVWLQPGQVICTGAYHVDGLRAVTAEDPAKPDEVIRVFMTGLTGTTPVAYQQPNPDGIAVANPPVLADPAAAEVVSFKLSPDEIGLQQIDLRIARAFTSEQLFSDRTPQFGCAVPAVAPAR